MRQNEVYKAAAVGRLEADAAELEAINRCSIKTLTEADVFLFRLIACGNEIDRDYEAFTTDALKTLAGMLDRRPIIRDHNPKADNQVARIYRTEVIQPGGTVKTGEEYAQLVAYCYMARTGGNLDLITEIEAGIKKEASIGCMVDRKACSICGADRRRTICAHTPGKTYGGQLCYLRLENPLDAYEVSFTAVPAQPEAGVVKSRAGEETQNRTEPQKTFAAQLKAAFQKTEEM